jgi:hypothetical protein
MKNYNQFLESTGPETYSGPPLTQWSGDNRALDPNDGVVGAEWNGQNLPTSKGELPLQPPVLMPKRKTYKKSAKLRRKLKYLRQFGL